MFKDDYKSVNDKITASSELKKRTLEMMNAKQEPKAVTYMRYGLVCASFLFIVAIFPVLYGMDGLTSKEVGPMMAQANDMMGATMPQTGVDESITYQDDRSYDKYHKSTEQIQEELRLKKMELEALLKEKEAPITIEKAEVIVKEKYDTEIKKIEAEVKSIIAQASVLIPIESININELTNITTTMRIKDFSAEEGYYEEQWTSKKVKEYLGTLAAKTYLPSDLAGGFNGGGESQTQRIVFNKDGTVAYDVFNYYFAEPQSAKEVKPTRRTLSIAVSKEKLPIDCGLYISEDSKTSIIKGFELKLGKIKQAYEYNEKNEPTKYFDEYIAEFIYNGVGYRIIANSLTQQEFIDVVASIIEPIPNQIVPPKK